MNTEEKIHRAATRVFTRKGYDGAKTRDIAREAGINVATLHYYYRTKDQLFDRIARESMVEFTSIHRRVFHLDLDLKEKITRFVVEFTDLFRDQPDLVMFCVTETERNPTGFQDIVDFREASMAMQAHLERLIAAGEIRPIGVQNFINSLVGMTIYPFLTRRTILETVGMDAAAYNDMLEDQKRIVPAMMIGYLYGE